MVLQRAARRRAVQPPRLGQENEGSGHVGQPQGVDREKQEVALEKSQGAGHGVLQPGTGTFPDVFELDDDRAGQRQQEQEDVRGRRPVPLREEELDAAKLDAGSGRV